METHCLLWFQFLGQTFGLGWGLSSRWRGDIIVGKHTLGLGLWHTASAWCAELCGPACSPSISWLCDQGK